jgi:VWFA-related protein
MRSRLVFMLAVALPTALGYTGSYSSLPAHAQSANREKPTLKEFGASLKRLKWDSGRQAAVENDGSSDRRNASSENDVIRVETDLVVCDVEVRDRQGNIVTGLTQSDFMVTDEGEVQHIGHFSLGNDQSVARSIVLIIDYSGSLRRYIDKSIEAAEILIDKLGPKDNMAIVTDDVELLVDFTRDRRKLKKALESLKKKAKGRHYGRSYQFTALMATARELFSEEDIRPIVIFQTDGDEVELLQPPDPGVYFLPEPQTVGLHPLMPQIKQFSLRDVYNAVEKSRATVYTVIPGTSLIGVSLEEQLKGIESSAVPPWFTHEQMALIARHTVRAQRAAAGAAIVSGGWTAFLEKPEQAADIYSTILSDINSRYVVGYYPTNKVHDGKRRKVLIEVRQHPEYVVSGRRSYYALGPDQ